MNISVHPMVATGDCEVAIVGAGPYGLAAAAHLRAAGTAVRVFGDPLSFWRRHMPDGMKLRSPWVATHIAHPAARYRLDDYFSEAGKTKPDLLPLEDFAAYGLWFQERVAPDLDRRKVLHIAAAENGFRLSLDDGGSFFARRVVMAVGLLGHEYLPPEFAALPRDLVSHSCAHTTSAPYRGRKVAVIGRGQSACEAAAILHEAGAEVEIVCRGKLVWNADPAQRSGLRKAARALLGDLLIPPSQVGPFPDNWLNETPGLIHRFSQARRDRHNEKSLRATAILWLRKRLADIPINEGRRIIAAERAGDRIALALDNGTRHYDHVLCATGYRIDVTRMDMLDAALRTRLARHRGLPVLSDGFQSSVPGLHFVGAAAVGSYGPLLRFIAGAGFAARHVTRTVLRGRRGASQPAQDRFASLSLAAERE
jgi:hypothetical protein